MQKNIDEIVLMQSREIMKLINSDNPGGEVQLQAKIHCYLKEQAEKKIPVYWELWCHDETCHGHWFLAERSNTKLLCSKNQVVIPFYTDYVYPPSGDKK